MDKQQLQEVEEDASNMAWLCRMAADAHDLPEQMPFVEALLADLTEMHDDLAHQQANPPQHEG